MKTDYNELFNSKSKEIHQYLLMPDEEIKQGFIRESKVAIGDSRWLFTPTDGVIRFLAVQAMKDLQLKIYEDHYYLIKDKISWNEVDKLYSIAFKQMFVENDKKQLDYNRVAFYFYELLMSYNT